jgi:hypothetical protein
MYPNILKNPHPSSNSTSYRIKSLVSKPICGGLMAWLRFRMRATANKFITPHIRAVMRNVHGRETLSIIAWIPKENNNPPTPDPADEIPVARLRFFSNHCERMGAQGTKMKFSPTPMRTPCERYKCHIWFANEAEMKPAVWRAMPINIGGCVPALRTTTVINGEKTSDNANCKPPTNA